MNSILKNAKLLIHWKSETDYTSRTSSAIASIFFFLAEAAAFHYFIKTNSVRKLWFHSFGLLSQMSFWPQQQKWEFVVKKISLFWLHFISILVLISMTLRGVLIMAIQNTWRCVCGTLLYPFACLNHQVILQSTLSSWVAVRVF